MKDLQQLHQQLAYRPFRPFLLETVAGSRIEVLRPDWFVEVPSGDGRTERFVVFHEGFVTLGHFSDLTDLIQAQDKSQP